ncbi:MAG: SDR family NAD(P)-dependent oxidoreductase [Actinomycetota bacterium]|nr:SDR family NAD(P)-dependent oxidoreductase [Actinomycetota bacterium]
MNDVTGMPESVVVLGGGSEIARALLVRLAGRRLRAVVLAGRDETALAAAARELESLGVPTVATTRFEASDVSDHEDLVRRALDTVASVDLLLVAAGALGSAELEALSPEAVARLVEANFTGPAAAMLAFARVMADHGHGRIVVLSSVAGVRVRRSNFVYGAAKAGLDGFSQGLGDALEGTGVRVTIVRPGFVRTRMTAGVPEAPLATGPEEVADAIVRGLERDAEVVWVPAVFRVLLALASHVPRALWRRIPS